MVKSSPNDPKISLAGNPSSHGLFILCKSRQNTVYPLVNFHIDPENSLVLMDTNLPTPMTARVYVNLPEGIMCVSFAFICYKESITGVLGSQSLSGYQSSYNQISLRHNLIGKKLATDKKYGTVSTSYMLFLTSIS